MNAILDPTPRFAARRRWPRGVALGAGLWGAAAVLMLLLAAPHRPGPLDLLNILLSSTWGALACMALWSLGERLTRGGRTAGALGFAAAVAIALGLHLLFELALAHTLRDPSARAVVDADRWYMALAMRLTVETRVLVHAPLYGAFGAAALSLFWDAERRRQERALSEARVAAAQAQLAALRFQLNPHFLFNTLNAIGALVVTQRNAEAERMLDRLSDFLRATLSEPPAGLTSLETELNTIQAYLEIEAVRFPDRLAVLYDCPADLREARVPGFLLQPLVENAIKHGVAPAVRKVTVAIAARVEGQVLVLSVADDGGGGASPSRPGGLGVGLSNVRGRLELLYGGRAALDAGPADDGYRAVLRLPLSRTPTEDPA